MKNSVDNNFKPKRKSHIVLIGFIIMLIGVCGFVTVLGINNWNINALNVQSTLTEDNYQVVSANENIILNVSNANIEIVGADTDKINVKYFESDKEKYVFNASNNALMITKTNNYKWYEYSILYMQSMLNREPMVVTVPKNYQGNIKVAVNSGSVSVKDLSVNKLEIIAEHGKINLDNVTATTDIMLDNDDAKVNLSNVVAGGKVSVLVENGKTNIENIKSSTLEVTSENGYINLSEVSVDKLIVLVENGSINLSRVDILISGDITSENGLIEGTIVGSITDFNITSDVDHGSNNLPDSTIGGSKTLNVETERGSVKITFVK